MKKRFLFVSPHPDDAELGIGATIIKLQQQGHDVFLIDLTSGEPTPYGSLRQRRQETERATRILGVKRRENLALENRYLSDTKQARLLLAEKIRQCRPDAIFCPYHEDAHPDHRAATAICEAARFYAKYTKIALKGKPHYTPYFFYYFCSHLRIMPKISFLVDVSGQWSDKLKALRCYRSQFAINKNNHFIFEYLKTLNRYLGMLAKVQYAEAVYSKEPVKVADLGHIL